MARSQNATDELVTVWHGGPLLPAMDRRGLLVPPTPADSTPRVESKARARRGSGHPVYVRLEDDLAAAIAALVRAEGLPSEAEAVRRVLRRVLFAPNARPGGDRQAGA